MTLIKTKVDGRTTYYCATTGGRIVLGPKSRAAPFSPELAATVLKHLKHLDRDRFADAELVTA